MLNEGTGVHRANSLKPPPGKRKEYIAAVGWEPVGSRRFVFALTAMHFGVYPVRFERGF